MPVKQPILNTHYKHSNSSQKMKKSKVTMTKMIAIIMKEKRKKRFR